MCTRVSFLLSAGKEFGSPAGGTLRKRGPDTAPGEDNSPTLTCKPTPQRGCEGVGEYSLTNVSQTSGWGHVEQGQCYTFCGRSRRGPTVGQKAPNFPSKTAVQ